MSTRKNFYGFDERATLINIKNIELGLRDLTYGEEIRESFVVTSKNVAKLTALTGLRERLYTEDASSIDEAEMMDSIDEDIIAASKLMIKSFITFNTVLKKAVPDGCLPYLAAKNTDLCALLTEEWVYILSEMASTRCLQKIINGVFR